MSEFIIFTDPHFYKNYSKSKLLENGRTSWLDTQILLVGDIFIYAKKCNVSTIIIDGDLFEEKNHLPQDLYNEVWNFFKKYSEDFRIILNLGNHDFLNLSRSSALQPFSDILEIVKTPTDIQLGNDLIRIVPFGMLGSPSCLQVPEGTYENKILCTHEEIQGLRYSNQTVIEEGFGVKAFRQWDIVFNGHIHAPQNTGNIINIGSPMIEDWGESSDKKRFIHYKDGKTTDLHLACPDFIEVEELTEDDRKRMEEDDYNYYRIHISSDRLSDPIFHKFNVFPKVDKKRTRESRMKEDISFEEKVKTYISLQETDLDKNKLAITAKELETEAGKITSDELSTGRFILKSLYAKNFRSYKELILKDIDKYGLTLISAPNGSGKSTVRLLIEYLLTDTTSDDVPLEELTFNKEGNCKMEGVFVREEDGAEIVITKYRDDKKNKDKTFLSINGESDFYTSTDRRETQKTIVKLFNVTKEILNISNIFSKNSLSFPEAKETERKKVIYDAMNLHKYTPLQDKAKQLKGNIEEEIGTLQKNLGINEGILTSLEEDMKTLTESKENWDKTSRMGIIDLKNTIEENEETIQKEIKNSLNLQSEIDKVKDDIPDNLDTMMKEFKDKKKETITELVKQKEILQSLNNIDYQIKVNQNIIKEEEKVISINKKDLEVEKKKLEDVIEEKELDKIEEKIETNNHVISTYKTEKKNLERELNKISNTICPILNIECNDLEKECTNLNKKYKGQIEELTEKISKEEDYSVKLYKNKESIKQELKVVQETKNTIKAIEKEIKNAEENVKTFTGKVIELQKKKEESSPEKLQRQIEINESLLETYELGIDSLEKKVLIKQDLELKKVKFDNIEKTIKNLIKQGKEYGKQLDTKLKEENPYTALISTKETELQDKKKSVQKIKKQSGKLSEQVMYYNFWITGFSAQGLPNLEISSFIDMLEGKTNQLLSSMTKDLSVHIDDQSLTKKGEAREKISYDVYSPTKNISSFFSYSGGQKQRILLADMLSFYELVGKFNFLILDEVLELSLDNSGKEDIIKLLTENFKEEPVFVVSHDDSIKSSFGSVIEITYENGVSSI